MGRLSYIDPRPSLAFNLALIPAMALLGGTGMRWAR